MRVSTSNPTIETIRAVPMLRQTILSRARSAAQIDCPIASQEGPLRTEAVGKLKLRAV
jgi:hypothetical protein